MACQAVPRRKVEGCKPGLIPQPAASAKRCARLHLRADRLVGGIVLLVKPLMLRKVDQHEACGDKGSSDRDDPRNGLSQDQPT